MESVVKYKNRDEFRVALKSLNIRMQSDTLEIRMEAASQIEIFLKLNESYFETLDFDLLFKGIFYFIWSLDKPLNQQRAADQLANITLNLSQPLAIGYLRGFWTSIIREWPLVDKYRINKLLLLMRRFVSAGFKLSINSNLEVDIIDGVNRVIIELPLSPQRSKVSKALRYHVFDIYLDELELALDFEKLDKNEVKVVHLDLYIYPMIHLLQHNREDKGVLFQKWQNAIKKITAKVEESSKPAHHELLITIVHKLLVLATQTDTPAFLRKAFYKDVDMIKPYIEVQPILDAIIEAQAAKNKDIIESEMQNNIQQSQKAVKDPKDNKKSEVTTSIQSKKVKLNPESEQNHLACAHGCEHHDLPWKPSIVHILPSDASITNIPSIRRELFNEMKERMDHGGPAEFIEEPYAPSSQSDPEDDDNWETGYLNDKEIDLILKPSKGYDKPGFITEYGFLVGDFDSYDEEEEEENLIARYSKGLDGILSEIHGFEIIPIETNENIPSIDKIQEKDANPLHLEGKEKVKLNKRLVQETEVIKLAKKRVRIALDKNMTREFDKKQIVGSASPAKASPPKQLKSVLKPSNMPILVDRKKLNGAAKAEMTEREKRSISYKKMIG